MCTSDDIVEAERRERRAERREGPVRRGGYMVRLSLAVAAAAAAAAVAVAVAAAREYPEECSH